MSDRGKSPSPAYLVEAADEVVVANEVRGLIQELLGDRDPSMALEEFAVTDAIREDPRPVIDAFMTPPFLVDRRIVVVRSAGALIADACKAIAIAVPQIPDGVVLVLAGGGGSVTPTLKKAVAAAGEVISVGLKSKSDKGSYVDEQLRLAPVRLSKGARDLLKKHLGEDVGRSESILRTLASAYGRDVTIDEDMLRPYLGQFGQIPPWDLTDAIESGKVELALSLVDRMMGPGGTSPHVIVVLLERRFHALALLDGADVRSADEAAKVAGVAPFVGKQLFKLSSRLSHEDVTRAVGLVTQADLDLKGDSGLDEKLIVEILAARLSRLCA